MMDELSSPAPHSADKRTGWHDETLALSYQLHLAALTSACISGLVSMADVKAGNRVLDVACGAGDATAASHREGADAIGLDFSAAQIRLAARAHPNLRFVKGDAEFLPFADATFDVVVNSFGMPVIADPCKASAEAFRVLKPGGRYAYTSWCDAPKCVGFSMTYDAVRTHGSLEVGLPPAPSVFTCGNLNFASDMLGRAGFEALSTTEIPLVWRASTPDVIIEAIFNGTVRAAALLKRQSPESLTNIRRYLRSRIESFERDGAFAVPVPAVIVAAQRPRC